MLNFILPAIGLGLVGFDPATQDRFAGYRLALQEADAPFDPTLIRYGDWKAESGYREIQQLLALPVPPTAVFVGNDEQCLGCIEPYTSEACVSRMR